LLTAVVFVFSIWLTGEAFSADTKSESSGDKKKESPQEASKKIPLPPFATVNGVDIDFQDYRMDMLQAIKSRFYHGKIPEGKMASLQREIGQDIVDKVLLIKEAKKRGIEPDKAGVQKILDSYDKQYANNERWKKERKDILPLLRKKLEEDSVFKILEKQVKESPNPTEAEIRNYYDTHHEKFTEPEQVRVSVILLSVDPSSSKEVWEQAEKEAKDIVKRLRGGASFADMAKLHSSDPSAEKGGDMGYLHRGMLADTVHAALDKISVGEITDPVVTLQGVGIFRLEDRKEAVINAYDNVRERARGLLLRELSDKVWNDLKADLRGKADIKINESYYMPMPKEGEGTGGEGATENEHQHGG